MSSRVLTLLTVFVLVPGIEAQPPVKPRADSLGDPLPEGAIARIGTLRFKHNPAQGSTVDVALFAPDGSKIVSLSQDYESLRLWDAASGKDIRGPWSTPNKRCSAVAFSPDSAKLAVVTSAGFFGNGQPARNEIIVYDIARAQTVKTITGIKHHARALAFADGGKTVISAGEGTVYWWDLDSGKEKRSWTVFPEEKKANEDGKVRTFLNCAFAPDAKSLAVEVAWRFPEAALNGGQFRNETAQDAVGFDLDTRKMTWRATGGRSPSLRYYRVASGIVITGQTSRLAFSADGKRVALPGIQDKVEVRDTVTGKLVIAPLEASAGNVLGLALSRDGSQVALASTDGNVILWNINGAGAPAAPAPRKFVTRIAQNRPYKRCLHFSPDDKKLLVGADADIQVYDSASLQEVQPWEGHRGWIDYVLFAADGKRLLTGSAKNNLHPQELASWDMATWKRLQLTSLLAPPWPNVGIVSPNQSVYADKGGADLFDLTSGKLLARLQVPKGQPGQARGFFSPSGKHYVLGSQADKGKSVERLYAVPSGKLLCNLPPVAVNYQPMISTQLVAFSGDERLVAIFGQDRMIHVCDTATGQERHRMESGLTEEGPGGGAFVANLTFSPDGRYLASWIVNLYDFEGDPRKKPIRVWDTATGKELLQVVPDSSNMRGNYYNRLVHFAWSPDSRVLAVGQNKIRLWEVATLGVRRELPGHGDASIQALAFSRDGRLLASGSADTTVLIWDTSMSGSGAPAAAALARGDLEKRWQALAEDDAAKAYAAIRELAAAPTETVAWVKGQLKPVEPVDPKRMEELIGQLDHDQFKVRQKATTELLQIGERLVPALDKALAGKPALETSLRLQGLRTRMTGLVLKGARLQAFRAVEVLEHISTPEARHVLQMLAGGAPGALVTMQAQGALARLQK